MERAELAEDLGAIPTRLVFVQVAEVVEVADQQAEEMGSMEVRGTEVTQDHRARPGEPDTRAIQVQTPVREQYPAGVVADREAPVQAAGAADRAGAALEVAAAAAEAAMPISSTLNLVVVAAAAVQVVLVQPAA